MTGQRVFDLAPPSLEEHLNMQISLHVIMCQFQNAANAVL